MNSKWKQSRKVFRGSIFILCSILIACATPVNEGFEGNSGQRQEETERYLEYLEEQTEMMVKNKASCKDMGDRLYAQHQTIKPKLKLWKQLKFGDYLAQKSVEDPSFAQKLNQLIIKADLVYSYCAYQSSFREYLNKLQSSRNSSSN